MEATLEDPHSQQAPKENINAYRSMRDHMHPPRMSAPSCIVPPTEQLVIIPHIVPLLPTFHGIESENPYAYIKEFEEVCNTFREGGPSINLMRLRLFPFTLKDKAKIWLNYLRPRTKENEKFYECWERYMEAINGCPHHGFDTWLLVSYFYDGMSSSMKQLLETMCGGDFMSKNLEEAMDFLSYVGMYTLNEDTDMKAKFAAMARRLEELEVKKIQEVQAISETPVQAMSCSICQSFEHLVVECPMIPAMREMFRDHANIDNLQYSISRLTNLNTVQEKGNFPSQPHQNPKGIHEVEAQEGESSQMREVKAVITLRGGKEVDLPISKSEHEPESEAEKEKREEIKGKMIGNSAKKKDLESTVNEEPGKTINQEDMMKKRTPPPFPQALHGKKGINNASEILEVLRQLKINILFARHDQTMQVSSEIQRPGLSYHLSDDWRDVCGESFMDLGASVNLIPYSVYKQLGLGELKPTSIALSLADRSVKIPRGMIEDILVQVDKFYYHRPGIPIILGRPFLATSNAIINCRNGVMQLTFGYMTLEFNIFYMCQKQFHPKEEEGSEEVCMIDNLVEEHYDQKMLEDLNESLGDLDEGGYLNPQICLLLCPI
ncbi:hypothetical protein CK203_107852 [Vitis vinifera]|uniref:Retrotransposon gag domain-containing protein n=1 Tax=Vitis vinifera TaxID=29760 RepID=A0A438CIA4_VITVI|nr:hypothetical protein CK203_107852 [Vitis vinifera]